MLYIEKKRPPRQYLRAVAGIRSSHDWKMIVDGDAKAIRSQFDLLPKEAIREALLVEQHFLCAYCMKRIRNDALHMTIEHWSPLSYDKERALDYQNFLGVCKGGADLDDSESGKRVLCCDASKGNEVSLTIDPLNLQMMQLITYDRTGLVSCKTNPGVNTNAINYDLNEVLKLNGKLLSDGSRIDTTTELIKGRRDAVQAAQQIYIDLNRKGRLTSAQLERVISQMMKKSEFPEFMGVILFFLERKKKSLEKQGK